MLKLISSQEEIEEVYTFIKNAPFDYPNYNEWAERCKAELSSGYKKAFIFKVNGTIVANLVFQEHKNCPEMLELKNGRVEAEHQGRGIFTLLYKAVEQYAQENGFKKIICDTHSENVAKIMEHLGFKAECKKALYGDNLETILVKEI